MPIKPLYDHVLVRPEKPEAVSKGGIILAPSAQKDSDRGTVVACGMGHKLDKPVVFGTEIRHVGKLLIKEGDLVLFPKYAGVKVTIDDEDLVMFREEELLGIISE